MFGPPSQKKLDKRMMEAIEYWHLDKLKKAVEDGANVQKAQGYYSTPVYRAVSRDNSAALAFLLEKGASPHATSEFYVPFVFAADRGSQPMMEMLLKAGADINARDTTGSTALHYVAKNGKAGLVRWLLEQGADATIADHQMNTPADVAEKEYPRLADLIRGKDPAATEAAISEGWRLTAADEVAQVSDKTAIGYRVTEIFNFSAQLYTRVTRNLETNAESQSISVFSALAEGTLVAQAQKAFQQLGGRLAAETGTVADKPRLQTPRTETGAAP